MSLQSVWQKCFSFFGKDVVVEPVEAQLTSDAGLIPFRELDERLRFTERFAAALSDARGPGTKHSALAMTRMRVYGILADYEDQNDHDVLRSDPLFKLIAGTSPDGPDLASQPTLSRFENSITPRDYLRLRDVFIDLFLESFREPPARLTFDIDTYDDPAHGKQQLVFFNGYYDQYQYQPRLITCAENDLTVMFCLLFGSAPAALGAEDDVEYLTRRVRQRFPDVEIHFRADSAFGVPLMFDACERSRVTYSIGEKMNKVLQRNSAEVLALATSQFAATGQPQRLFTSFDYQAGSWDAPRFTLVKAEANAEGTNRRAVITNRPGARLLPEATYDEYADRGESENRNKEIKLHLHGGRLSDHRYFANLFRLALHCAAQNLLVRMRQVVANVPTDRPMSTIVVGQPELPVEALPQPQRASWFNHRREKDPLGEGHAPTWRTRLIKVAAEVIVTSRRILIRLSGTWPYLDHYADISDQILALVPAPSG